MALYKTRRYSRHTYGDDGQFGRRNICSVSFVATDLMKPAAASTTALMAATAASTSASTLTPTTTELTTPRNLTVTVAASTAAHIAAGNITVTGKNVEGKTITENFAVTGDTAGTITGNKAFATVSSVAVPAQDGASVTVALGTGAKLGIGMRNIASMPIKILTINGSTEALEDASASAFSATDVESNTVTPTTTPTGAIGMRVYVLNYKFHANPTNAQPDYGV